MFTALRCVRSPAVIFNSPLSNCHQLGRNSNSVRFRQAAAGGNQPDQKMDKKEASKQVTEKGDVMSHSFGEGYATRSDEEGFGGIHGGNQSFAEGEDDKNVHGNSPEYDKSQGSEVKEKEKGRHQTNASS